MRFVVFIFGLLACFITLTVGGALLSWDMFLGMVREHLPPDFKVEEIPTTSMTGISHAHAGICFALAGAYGLLGSLFALFRCGRQGGLLMLIPLLAAGATNPWALLFCALQGLVALLSFLVGPLPLNPPEEKKPGKKKDVDEDMEESDEDEEEDEEEEEEEEVKPKAKKKR